MAILVSANNLTKAFGARPLFDDLSFTLQESEKVGLIGPNGAGKSTLLKLLAGQASPDRGTLSMKRGLQVGLLEQVPAFKDGATIESTVLEGASSGGRHEDWERITLVQESLSRLQLDQFEASTPIATLSGGWKKRVALARELVREPDLLLLDEPTNHLDVESIQWLEGFIRNARFATLTITHDRLFLQKISDRILELDRHNIGGILSVNGSYADYLDIKDQMIKGQERREVILKNTLRRETEWLRRGAKARTTKQQARIQRHGELSTEVGELEYRNQSKTARLDFQSADRNPKKLLEAKHISKKLGGKTLFSKFSVLITPGARIGLLGANGCGKSTLLRTLLGDDKPDEGEVFRSDQLKVAYFEQNREALDPGLSLSKTLCPSGDFVDYRGGRVHIRSYLDRFLFTQAQMEMAVGKLSGGEQSRILIAKLMLQPANLLVLDEPTNDLDMATLTVLEDCLKEFDGAVLLVTHDRYFLAQVATKILAFEDGGKTHFFADLDQWETWQEGLPKSPTSRPGKNLFSGKAVEQSSAPSSKKRLSFKEQREYDGMESSIHTAEAELADIETQSQDPANASNAKKLSEITTRMTELQSTIEGLYGRWAELQAKLS